jgi:dienelactone hydrolase
MSGRTTLLAMVLARAAISTHPGAIINRPHAQPRQRAATLWLAQGDDSARRLLRWRDERDNLLTLVTS